jgi:pimeloyl-ACP methyl ester carboxylesterase
MRDGSTLVRGVNYHYSLHEGKEPVTIVLIHGLGGSKEYLKGIMNFPELAECSVLIPDLVGFGDTKAPAGFGYTMREQAEHLADLIKALRLSGGFLLIPHSMGGPIGVYLAEMLRDRVKGVVYAEGNTDLGDCFSSNQVITEYSFDEYKASGFRKGLEATRRGADPARIAWSQEKAGAETVYRSSLDLVKVSKEDTMARRLRDLGVPVLAVYGAKNRGLWTSEKKLAALFPLVFIPGAGHLMMVDNPDAFYGEVAAFLKRL